MKMLKNMLQERREMPRKQQTDFFDYVIEELGKKGTMLTEAIALDLMFVLLFASFETTSLALTYAIKLLSDNPLVFKQLQVRYRYIILAESLELFFMALQDTLVLTFLDTVSRKNTKPSSNGVKILTLESHGKNTSQ
jgi:hypothetical protein